MLRHFSKQDQSCSDLRLDREPLGDQHHDASVCHRRLCSTLGAATGLAGGVAGDPGRTGGEEVLSRDCGEGGWVEGSVFGRVSSDLGRLVNLQEIKNERHHRI